MSIILARISSDKLNFLKVVRETYIVLVIHSGFKLVKIQSK